MTGASTGPGAGPEVLGALNPQLSPEQSYNNARDYLATVARAQPDNDALRYLLAQLGAGF